MLNKNKTKNKNNNYFCHSELVSESITTSAWRVGANLNGSCQRANGFRTKSGMTTEGGRSMVEMLGVLAIIGVLSVGGIAGYTMAMNKHRANEILQGASMRAMTVSAQIQTKPTLTTPSLGEFTGDTPAGVTITVATRTATDTQFKLNLSGVDPAVCTQMKAVVSADSNNPKISDDDTCSTLTYNNDLGSGAGAGSAKPTEDACTGIGGTLVSDGNYCLVASDMTWKSAYELCNSSGMHGMVSLSDFSCEEVSVGNECPVVKGDDDLKSTYFWTFDCYNQTCEDNKLTNNMDSGDAFLVDLDTGGVSGGYFSRVYNYYALCVR